jgi:hypothetical protein
VTKEAVTEKTILWAVNSVITRVGKTSAGEDVVQYVEGHSDATVAEQLGTTEGAVRKVRVELIGHFPRGGGPGPQHYVKTGLTELREIVRVVQDAQVDQAKLMTSQATQFQAMKSMVTHQGQILTELVKRFSTIEKELGISSPAEYVQAPNGALKQTA